MPNWAKSDFLPKSCWCQTKDRPAICSHVVQITVGLMCFFFACRCQKWDRTLPGCFNYPTRGLLQRGWTNFLWVIQPTSAIAAMLALCGRFSLHTCLLLPSRVGSLPPWKVMRGELMSCSFHSDSIHLWHRVGDSHIWVSVECCSQHCTG